MYAMSVNPVHNVFTNALGIITGAAYLAVAATCAAITTALGTLLPAIAWLIRTLFADSKHIDKPTRLALVLMATAIAAMLAPALTGCVVLLVVFAMVTKPRK